MTRVSWVKPYGKITYPRTDVKTKIKIRMQLVPRLVNTNGGFLAQSLNYSSMLSSCKRGIEFLVEALVCFLPNSGASFFSLNVKRTRRVITVEKIETDSSILNIWSLYFCFSSGCSSKSPSSYESMKMPGRRKPTNTPNTFICVPIMVAMERSLSGNQFVVTSAGELYRKTYPMAIMN